VRRFVFIGLVLSACLFFGGCSANPSTAQWVFGDISQHVYKIDYRGIPAFTPDKCIDWIRTQFGNVKYIGRYGGEWIIYCEESTK
jgi:hypothetical protein